MSNIQNIDLNLQEIVKNISKNSYLIPKFQRDFVWKNTDIIDLGDSIIRGYPISSFLFMAENGNLNVSTHSMLNEKSSLDQGNEEEGQPKFYVLDGQQRLTTIAKLFISLDDKNEYYFDMLSMLISKFPNDRIEDDEGVKHKFGISRITEEALCRSFPISADRSEKPTRMHNRFISGKNIIENRFGSVISKFLACFQHQKDEYIDYLNGVLGAVGGYSIPATIISRDSELDVVIRVFEKVNSTGKKLTVFDLINAKSFQTTNPRYKVGLSKYLTDTLLNSIVCSDQAWAIKAFLKYDEHTNSFEKLDKIIRILEIAHLLTIKQMPAIFKSKMLEKNADFWFENWNNHINNFIHIVSWIGEEGLMDIGQITYLEYMMAIFLAHPKAFENKSFKTKVAKYAFCLSLNGTSFNKSNLDIVERLYDIADKMTRKLPFSDLSYALNLSSDDVLEITPSISKFKAIINTFYIQKVSGKFTVDIVGNSIRSNDTHMMDKHHIFPKSKVTKFNAKSEFNSIANYLMLEPFENREVIRDEVPSIYFKKLVSNTEKIKYYCEQNLLNYDEVIAISNEATALDFIKRRARRIADLLNQEYTTNEQPL